MDQDALQVRLQTLKESLSQTLQALHDLPRVQPNQTSRAELNSIDTERYFSTIEARTSEIYEVIHENIIVLEDDLSLVEQDLEDWSATTKRQANLYIDEEPRKLISTTLDLSNKVKLIQKDFRKAKLNTKFQSGVRTRQSNLEYLADLRCTRNESEFISSDPYRLTRLRTSQSEMRISVPKNIYRADHGGMMRMNEDIVLSQSSDLTAALWRTHELLSREVSRSRYAQEMLNASNVALENLNHRYGALDDLLNRSRHLLSSLLRNQKSDTWYLETAIWILISTVCWLTFRRILYGPVWWLIYLPCKMICARSATSNISAVELELKWGATRESFNTIAVQIAEESIEATTRPGRAQ